MKIQFETGDKVYLPDEHAERFYIIKTINRRAVMLEPCTRDAPGPIVRGITEIMPALTTTENAKIIN